jgi:pilus assembly protein Flp/PilA
MVAAIVAVRTWMASRTEQDDRGAALVEYALLIALIVLVCVVGVQFFGTATSGGFSSAGTSMAN